MQTTLGKGEVIFETIKTTIYRPGFGTVFEGVWQEEDWGEKLADVVPYLVEINPETVKDISGVAAVPIYGDDLAVNNLGELGQVIFWVPVENFKDVPELWQDDTHDFRTRWFSTKEEAEKHIEYTMKRYRHPQPWESFITFD